MRMHARAVAGAVLAGFAALTAVAGCGDVDGTSQRDVPGAGAAESAGPTETGSTGTDPAETDGDDPAETDGDDPASPSGSADPDVRIVDAADAELVLHASNQSFADATVRMQITVDGVVVADQDFEVGSQHNWYTFPLDLPPGEHEVLVVADTGIRTRHTVRIPDGEVRYAVADYWDDGDGKREITWLAQAEPLAFA